MNIWLPIITNLIILGILVAGIFVGKKNGWKIELSKFILSAATIVGLYFLCPIVTKALLGIEAIMQICLQIPYFAVAINSIVYLVLFLFVYMIISLICGAIRRHQINKQLNTVKAIKIKRTKGQKIDRKSARQVKRENHKRFKEQRRALIKARTKKNKVFGALLGILTAVLVSFMVMLPIKYVFKGIAQAQPELSQIEKGFEYTPYGQLDKLTNINDIVNHIGE